MWRGYIKYILKFFLILLKYHYIKLKYKYKIYSALNILKMVSLRK